MTALEEAELRQLAWIAHQKAKCAAKTKFYSAGAATIHRGAHSKRTAPKLYAYHCTWCGFWHMTSLKPRVVEQRERRRHDQGRRAIRRGRVQAGRV